jgi:hypothetical protein
VGYSTYQCMHQHPQTMASLTMCPGTLRPLGLWTKVFDESKDEIGHEKEQTPICTSQGQPVSAQVREKVRLGGLRAYFLIG